MDWIQIGTILYFHFQDPESIFLNAATSDCQTQQVCSFKQTSFSILLKKKVIKIKIQAGKQ